MRVIYLDPQRLMNRKVSHIPGVRASVFSEAKKIELKAQTKLLQHRYVQNATDHEVNVTRGTVDSFVNLDGPAPGAIEFGHWLSGAAARKNARPKWVRGLYILTGAAGLLD